MTSTENLKKADAPLKVDLEHKSTDKMIDKSENEFNESMDRLLSEIFKVFFPTAASKPVDVILPLFSKKRSDTEKLQMNKLYRLPSFCDPNMSELKCNMSKKMNIKFVNDVAAHQYVLTSFLPGFAEDDIKIQLYVDANEKSATVTVTVENKSTSDSKSHVICDEIDQLKKMSREETFKFTEDPRRGLSSTFVNGVLNIYLPYLPPVDPKIVKIDINKKVNLPNK